MVVLLCPWHKHFFYSFIVIVSVGRRNKKSDLFFNCTFLVSIKQVPGTVREAGNTKTMGKIIALISKHSEGEVNNRGEHILL